MASADPAAAAVVHRAAVLGSPVAHSLSPALHTAAYAALGLAGWAYTRVECEEFALAEFVAGLGPEWAGLSLTMPLKRVALEVATEVSQEAAAIGAANTLLLAPGRRRAENTDAPGMADALRAAGLRTAGDVVVLGAGGTAQAALAALAGAGAGGRYRWRPARSSRWSGLRTGPPSCGPPRSGWASNSTSARWTRRRPA